MAIITVPSSYHADAPFEVQSLNLCPCGKKLYAQCCEPYHRRLLQASTPEILLRARYSAYAKKLTNYIHDTWHPSTRPLIIHLPHQHWIKLQIHKVQGNLISFSAFYRIKHQTHELQEKSEFVFENNQWYYRNPWIKTKKPSSLIQHRK